MTAVPPPPSQDDFHPPYHLGAFGCALVGVWDDAPTPPPEDRGGFAPVRWGSGTLGAALVLRYDRPPPDYPVAYSEVICSSVARRGLHWAAMPFDLVLDNPFYVEAGLLHYHLPKRLDPTLAIDVGCGATGAPERITASGEDLAFECALEPVTVPCAKGLLSTLLRVFTNHVPILGTSSAPPLRTVIGVSPDPATAYAAEGARLTCRGRTLRPMGGLFWQSLAITVGVPAPLAR